MKQHSGDLAERFDYALEAHAARRLDQDPVAGRGELERGARGEHRIVGGVAVAAGVPHVQVVNVDDIPGAARLAHEWAGPGGWILVKASRGMRLERVVDALRGGL